MKWAHVLTLLVSIASFGGAAAAEPQYTRTKDVIYGRKHGMALTLDVFSPAKGSNGLGVIFLASLGWGSNCEVIDTIPLTALLTRGYTVFAVVHGSKPKFTIPEVLEDVHRAVRYIRYHAGEYNIDPKRIGVTGISSGGHLALMLATAGQDGKPNPSDPVSRTSSRVQAVACFFSPTDFLNYETPGEDAIGRGILAYYRPAFDFHEFDPREKIYRRVEDERKTKRLGREISPITHVSPDDPPTLIIHGDADMIVPICQAETFMERLQKVGVAVELVVKAGAGHLYDGWEKDMSLVADWLDRHLLNPDDGV